MIKIKGGISFTSGEAIPDVLLDAVKDTGIVTPFTGEIITTENVDIPLLDKDLTLIDKVDELS